jgi:hypothetical protein
MRLRITATIGLVSLALVGAPALAAQLHPGPIGAHPYIPPGPCGYGRVQKTVCGVHQHKPAAPVTVCHKICVAG